MSIAPGSDNSDSLSSVAAEQTLMLTRSLPFPGGGPGLARVCDAGFLFQEDVPGEPARPSRNAPNDSLHRTARPVSCSAPPRRPASSGAPGPSAPRSRPASRRMSVVLPRVVYSQFAERHIHVRAVIRPAHVQCLVDHALLPELSF